MAAPLIPLEHVALGKSMFEHGGHGWKATTLIRAAKEQNCKPFDLPLAGLDLSSKPWGRTDDIVGFVFHAHRMLNADLKYPIILDDSGYICDGWHRVARAIIEKKATIKAMRLNHMPEPDYMEEQKVDRKSS